MAMRLMRRTGSSDDPRRLWDLVERMRALSSEDGIGSVIVGLAAPEGDLAYPDLVDFVESELRIEDAMFRMTRERTVLFLVDVALGGAEGIVMRILLGFREEFPALGVPEVRVGYYEVTPPARSFTAGSVLQSVFTAATPCRLS